jgi:uncharacterized protein (DUF2126 family)
MSTLSPEVQRVMRKIATDLAIAAQAFSKPADPKVTRETYALMYFRYHFPEITLQDIRDPRVTLTDSTISYDSDWLNELRVRHGMPPFEFQPPAVWAEFKVN